MYCMCILHRAEEVTPAGSRAEGVKICATWSVSHRKGMRSRECFTDKIKRIRRMRERREVEYIFHVIRER